MPEQSFWDKEIAVEHIGGVPFKMYRNRPRRVAALLPFAACWPDRAYIIQGERTLTFQGLLRGSADKARLLAREGVKQGDAVFILGWNGPDWILNFWACLRMGAVPVLANAWWSGAELADALELIKPILVLADRQGSAKVPAGWRTGHWAADETAGGPDRASPSAEALASSSENDEAAIIFTSGTQGRPKAVVLAHRSLLSNQMMILHVTRKLPYTPEPAAGDVGLHTGPLFHIGGLHALLRGVLVGNTIIFGRGRFDPGEALELIERYRIVRWASVPTMATRIVEHPDLPKRDVSSLTAMTIGGSPVHTELLDRLRAHLPSVQARIATGYGLSENAGQATTASGKDTERKPGTCGRAMPLAELKTVPIQGLPDGEIWIRSPTQMLRYFGNSESPIDAEGWLHSGDLGRLDADGFVWITGRSKDIIIRGGENIAPAAVEEALAALPGVTETAVFGIPHREFGEEVAAVVVVDAGVTEAALTAQLRARLASFSVPTLWDVRRDPLPVNQTGKIDKVALRREILAIRNAAAAPAS